MEPSFDKITRSKFYEIGSVLWDIVALSLIWLVFSLPVVTSAASSSALYFALYRRIKKESDNTIPDFMRSFKSNLKQSIPLSLLYTFFGVAVAFNIRIAKYGINGILLPDWYLPLSLLLIIPFITMYAFAYPYLARFTNDTKHIIMNAATLSSMNPGKALLLFLISALSVALIILFPPCILVAPFIAAYLKVMIAEKVFEAAIEKESNMAQEEEEDA